MSLSEETAVSITVLKIKNLKGSKSENWQAAVRLEFGEKLLGESAKVDTVAGTEATDVNFNVIMPIAADNPFALDELACRPVLVIVSEVTLPKDRNKGAEKLVVLGQCTIDLLPLLRGEMEMTVSLTLLAVPGSPLENLPAEQAPPELEVQLSILPPRRPLVHPDQQNKSNIFSITAECLYSPPDSWNVATSQSQGLSYVLGCPIPVSADKENVLVFAGGQLKNGCQALKDPTPIDKRKRWPIPAGALGGAVYIPGEVTGSDPVEQEQGDFRGKDDQEHRKWSETSKLQVIWNSERRCYLDPSAVTSFKERISQSRYWPVEVFRTSIGAPNKRGGREEEGTPVSFHGVAYVDVAPLLFPGVTRVRGAYKVLPYFDADLQAKTRRNGSVYEDTARIATCIVTRVPSLTIVPRTAGGVKKDEKKGDPAKGVAGAKTDPKAGGKDEQAEQAPTNPEGEQYAEAKSYVMIEICLDHPLVEKDIPEELYKRVSELIPPRPMFPKRTNCAEKAVEDFHGQVSSVASMLLDEFRELIGGGDAGLEKTVLPVDDFEEKRQKLVYQLNTSGKYLAFKEQLKHSVVKIVREKYTRTTAFKDKNELQAFLCELYVYLIDEMHAGLNKTLLIEDQRPVPEPITTTAQLKHFAREAEVNENYTLAEKYYQDIIAKEKDDPNHWLDYGAFCLYQDDFAKAEECFKESVSMDQKHLHGFDGRWNVFNLLARRVYCLLLSGIVLSMQSKVDEAEALLKAATALQPCSILAWTIFGLHYEGIGNEILAEMALGEANKLNYAQAVAEVAGSKLAAEVHSPLPGDEEEKPPQWSASLDEFTYQEHAVPELETSKGKGGRGTPKAKPGAKSPDQPAEAGKDAAPGKQPAGGGKASPDAKKGKGKGKGAVVETEEVYEEPPIVPEQTIYMQAINFLIEYKALPFAERALAHHLLDSLGGATSQYFTYLARIKLQKREFEEVEENCKRATDLHYQNADAWAIYGHMKYLVGDVDAAKSCYERILSFEVCETPELHSIYLRLASIHLQAANFSEAKQMFLSACLRTPSCVSWLGVGISCYRMGELRDAEDALTEANLLNNLDPEVWAYLSLICLKTNRPTEAEQAYKYAMKLNLADEELIKELNFLQDQVGFGNPSF